MAELTVVNPIRQPMGTFRLLNWLEEGFQNENFSRFKCAVAFAKAGPFYKLDSSYNNWKSSGKSSLAIIGVDHKGTSLQALNYLLKNYDETYVVHTNYSTFHPKLYLFAGEKEASIFYGSNNLTPGGTETNFEGGILLNLKLPDDIALLAQAEECFQTMLPHNLSCCLALTQDLIETLLAQNYLLDESLPKDKTTAFNGERPQRNIQPDGSPIFGKFTVKPPETMKKWILEKYKPQEAAGEAENNLIVKANTIPVKGLVIQIVPHHNGEVFLSKRAIDQNPSFFGFPFLGRTVPKKASNASYPQRIPDPIVNIFIYDNAGNLVRSVQEYALNTVFYKSKSEIRITISPDILSTVSEYSILVMTNSNVENCDYDLNIFNPGSMEYQQYLTLCDQQLPSGGKAIPRKMGWI